jgi:hypothetical protein
VNRYIPELSRLDDNLRRIVDVTSPLHSEPQGRLVFRGKLKKGIPFERAELFRVGSCESVA